MATEFSREFFSENRIVKADLRAAHQLREEDIARIKAEVKKLYDATEVILNVSVDESLLSGYVLQVGDRVFDNSGRHQLDQMMAGKPSLATLKTRIEDYKPAQTSAEGGVVISSADGIVQVEGMDKAVYGEIVTFENGAKGMVESVDPGKLGIMLFDGAETVRTDTPSRRAISCRERFSCRLRAKIVRRCGGMAATVRAIVCRSCSASRPLSGLSASSETASNSDSGRRSASRLYRRRKWS